MPEMNDLELIGKIRETYSADEPPIVLVTTQTDVRADNDFKHEKITDVVEKPFSSDGIRWLVRKYKA
jgi:CheY-like chemotaxis protein